MRIQDLIARGNRNGMLYKAGRVIELINVVMSDNAEVGISALGGRVRGSDVELSHNGEGGLYARVDKMVRLTAVGNGPLGGVYALPPRRGRPMRLVDSTVIGNNGLGRGFDVLSEGSVKLLNTTCGRGARVRSRRSQNGGETRTVIRGLRCAGG